MHTEAIKHFLLYQILIILSIVFVVGGLFFSLYAVKQIEKEQVSNASLLIQVQEADKKMAQIREARARREAERRREEAQRDILPGGDETSIGVSAKSFILAKTNQDEFDVIYQKNAYQKFPIASLTKVMTALIILENYNLNDIVTVSKESVGTEGYTGGLMTGERLTILDLLKIMLIESSNDAAEALAENFPAAKIPADSEQNLPPREYFIQLMNNKTKELNLANTHFSNPTGLDDPENYSTTHDLAKFISSILDKDTIWAITRIKTAKLQSQDGRAHFLKNSNRLLSEMPEIYGGKTGFTEEAEECMILVVKTDEGYLISIVLGSEDRFSDTIKLIKSK